jgi:hypothetical protein
MLLSLCRRQTLDGEVIVQPLTEFMIAWNAVRYMLSTCIRTHLRVSVVAAVTTKSAHVAAEDESAHNQPQVYRAVWFSENCRATFAGSTIALTSLGPWPGLRGRRLGHHPLTLTHKRRLASGNEAAELAACVVPQCHEATAAEICMIHE